MSGPPARGETLPGPGRPELALVIDLPDLGRVDVQRRQPAAAVAVRVDADQVSQVEDLRSEEHTSELQSLTNLVCRLLLEKKKK